MNRAKLVTCGVCGQRSFQKKPRMRGHVTFQDLDMRPHEPMRTDMLATVCRCPNCGLCCSDLHHGDPNWKPALETAAYRKTLTNPYYPAHANSLLCLSLLNMELGQIGSAGFCSLEAAWVCDDSNYPRAARDCRSEAGDWMLRAQQEGWTGFGVEWTILTIVDTFRRAGRMHDALDLVETSYDAASVEAKRLLAFQLLLINASDDKRHTLAEAEGRLRHWQPTTEQTPLFLPSDRIH